MRINYFSAILLLFALFLIFTLGCKRESVLENPILPVPPVPTPSVVNDAIQVTASVSGIVLDESNAPIASAVVTSGAATTTTNSNGMFIFQNISLSKENGSVTVVKAGYFKGIRSFKSTAGKNHTVRLQLMQKLLSGTVSASTGGTINSNGGATIIFPATAFVTSTGAAYTGTVNVYSRWINPTAPNLPFIIPGDLRGVGTDGAENLLETYGMVGAELEDASGNTLKIATGKKATISFPLPASLQASAPATIQLWHFDDATARWKENGTAAKAGSTYTAQVDKFSFWNVDVPNANFINLDYTLINATTNSPLVSTSTRIKRANGNYGYGITNNAGFVSGLVPKNEALVLEVIATSACNSLVYTQNIGPFASSTSLGNVLVTSSSIQTITFTGALTNCSGGAVTNGYVALAATGGNAAFGNTNATGAFSFSIINCTGSNLSYNYQGTDITTTQQTALLTGAAANGTIMLGTLAACTAATTADVYVAGMDNGTAKVWKNGVASNLFAFSDSAVVNSVYVSGNDIYAAGREGNVAKVWKNGIASSLTNIANGGANAFSVYVVGNDVYVAGRQTNITSGQTTAKLWKNGIPVNLSINTTRSSQARSVFVIGSDVYVAGDESISAFLTTNINNNNAIFWKNGIVTNLTNNNNGNEYGYASSVFVSGNDVYVAGGTDDSISGTKPKATFWKNGVPTYLTNGINDANTSSIFVSGNDVYISGTEYFVTNTSASSIGKFWKNGVVTNLSSGGSYTYVTSVSVKNTDVYLTGYTYNNGMSQNAFVWKNGLLTNFFNATNNNSAYSIFVK